MIIAFILGCAVFWGIICHLVGKSKGISGFWWGFCLGFIGLIVVLCMERKKTEVVPQANYTIENNSTTDNYNNNQQ